MPCSDTRDAGVAENKINELFMRASQNRPAIIFIDLMNWKHFLEQEKVQERVSLAQE